MSALQEISYYRNICNEVPNQELARKLAETEDYDGIAEIVEHLQDKNNSVASDCLKVLYELGYLRPDLIADYVDEFLALLSSKTNRMVWGGMIALATIAPFKPHEIMAKYLLIQSIMEKGTVITVVWGARLNWKPGWRCTAVWRYGDALYHQFIIHLHSAGCCHPWRGIVADD